MSKILCLFPAATLFLVFKATASPVRSGTNAVHNDDADAVFARTKRSIFVPNHRMSDVSHLDSVERVTVIRYCWKVKGYDKEKSWIQEALNETWNSLVVVRFVSLGMCDCSDRNCLDASAATTLIVGETSSCKGNAFGKDGINFSLYFGNSSSCKPECSILAAKQQCVKKTAVHEFGHALGLMHVQYRHDTPAFYADQQHDCVSYAQYETDKQWVHERFHKYLGPWDKLSVMNYCRPGYTNWTQHNQLSLSDRAAVLSVYGTAAYFNSNCTSTDQAHSAACQQAIHEFCRKVASGSTNATGILRGVTEDGFNVTCLKADFTIVGEATAMDMHEQSIATPNIAFAAGIICERWTSMFEQDNTTQQFGVVARYENGNRMILCKELTWSGEISQDELIHFANETGDYGCSDKLRLESNTAETYPEACMRTADEYCELRHHGAGGVIRSLDAPSGNMEIGCFEAELKFELLTKRITHV